MRKLIVTGANGVGKSHVATRLAAARPEVPVFSFDAIKLTRDWHQRPRPEIDNELLQIIRAEAWILEGGPSLLDQALSKADGVIWLDPPELIRAWRLFTRPWRNYGKTRPELPAGNVDWPLQQYRFAMRSLRNRSKLRNILSRRLREAGTVRVWHCRRQKDIDAAVSEWCNDAKAPKMPGS